jgi:excisionase family DNA binding protein
MRKIDSASASESTLPIPSWLCPIERLLLTPREAAAALRISERLLWSKTKLGEIPCIRIGKAVRYSPAALQAWIERASNA